MIAVLTFCRTMYEMKYIAHTSVSTFVVVGMPRGASRFGHGFSRAR
jgi:hypothetical protein